MRKDVTRRETCRLCESPRLELVVPITATPPGDAYVTREKVGSPQPCYPLDMYMCLNCGHVQLRDVVNPQILFGHYTYFSGNSPGLVKHFEEYAGEVIRETGIQPGDLVVDIGSNDGTFLRFFKNHGCRVLGIDPAENVARFATERGIPTLPEFMSISVARRVRGEFGPAKVVAANNVFAHTDDMIGMADSVCELLADDGVFVFEVSYLMDVIDKMLLGTIFHEHLCYHAVRPLQAFLKRRGMELIDVKRVTIQGGSLIGIAQRIGGPRRVQPSVGELIALEDQRRLGDPATLRAFSREVDRVRDEMRSLLRRLHQEGNTLAGFGAARGGTLLLYHFELGPLLSFIVDDNPEKHGMYSPGHHIPVLPTSALYERRPEYTVILAWVHSKPIIRNHQRYLEQGGRFITCYPHMMVVDRSTQPFW
ncbi:MAG: class I SAM-dependent methyltransferase [Kiritimatiellae bacterium]|nr:class I SAM-dependent methyltransferase [Kiritimatiellia bacterium]MDW8458697.1 class I SAM-dependent methyltransferase [Verrucomicrobiota bacterium]